MAVNQIKQVFQGSMTAKRFVLVFHRPKTAVPVDPGARAESLRKICANLTRVSSGFIQAQVTPKEDGCEEFTIEILNDPTKQIVDQTIQAALKNLTPETLWTAIADGSGLQRRFITIKEVT